MKNDVAGKLLNYAISEIIIWIEAKNVFMVTGF